MARGTDGRVVLGSPGGRIAYRFGKTIGVLVALNPMRNNRGCTERNRFHTQLQRELLGWRIR
jgi:hypothetical protein